MKTIRQPDILNEAVAIIWLEDMVTSENEEEILTDLQLVKTSMLPERKSVLINRLFEKLTILTFGELLSKSLVDDKLASVDIGLSDDIINDLKKDKIVANSIPVFILKELLDKLRISFAEAKESILKSFEIIKNNVSTIDEQFSVHPSFRKGIDDSDIDAFRRIPNKDLFENEVSLNKYLERLEKIMPLA